MYTPSPGTGRTLWKAGQRVDQSPQRRVPVYSSIPNIIKSHGLKRYYLQDKFDPQLIPLQSPLLCITTMSPLNAQTRHVISRLGVRDREDIHCRHFGG
jgi:hypothetical protein